MSYFLYFIINDNGNTKKKHSLNEEEKEDEMRS